MSTDVRGLTISRGRSSVQSQFSAGTATIELDNRDGDYDPNNSSSPHDPNLKLGTPVRIQATYDGTTYDQFYGHITSWPLQYPEKGKDGVAVLECAENLAILNTTRLTAESYSQESPDTRIGNVLDDASWPAGARDLNTADIIAVAAVTVTGQAGEAIRQAVEAEQGHFFIAKNGDATFRERSHISGLSSQATFNPGTNLDYESVVVLYDDDLLINFAEVTGTDDSTQTATDSTSVTDHGERSFSTSNDFILNSTEATGVAEWIVNNRKDVDVRITGLTIQPANDPTNLWPEVLDRELLDLITVVVDPPGAGDSLNQKLTVEGINHNITPGLWTVSYTCHKRSGFAETGVWILGTSQLDTDTIFA